MGVDLWMLSIQGIRILCVFGCLIIRLLPMHAAACIADSQLWEVSASCLGCSGVDLQSFLKVCEFHGGFDTPWCGHCTSCCLWAAGRAELVRITSHILALVVAAAARSGVLHTVCSYGIVMMGGDTLGCRSVTNCAQDSTLASAKPAKVV